MLCAVELLRSWRCRAALKSLQRYLLLERGSRWNVLELRKLDFEWKGKVLVLSLYQSLNLTGLRLQFRKNVGEI